MFTFRQGCCSFTPQAWRWNPVIFSWKDGANSRRSVVNPMDTLFPWVSYVNMREFKWLGFLSYCLLHHVEILFIKGFCVVVESLFRVPDFSAVKEGSACLAKMSDGLWHRCTVEHVDSSTEDEFHSCSIKFSHNGITTSVSMNDLHPLPEGQFSLLSYALFRSQNWVTHFSSIKRHLPYVFFFLFCFAHRRKRFKLKQWLGRELQWKHVRRWKHYLPWRSTTDVQLEPFVARHWKTWRMGATHQRLSSLIISGLLVSVNHDFLICTGHWFKTNG